MEERLRQQEAARTNATTAAAAKAKAKHSDHGVCTLIEGCALRFMLNKQTRYFADALEPFRAAYADCTTVVVGLHMRMGAYQAYEMQAQGQSLEDRVQSGQVRMRWCQALDKFPFQMNFTSMRCHRSTCTASGGCSV